MQEHLTRSEPQKVHIGDILENHYASDNNPARKSVVIAVGAYYVTCVYAYKGHICKANYYTRDVHYNEKFIVVGHADIVKMLDAVINKENEG